MTGNAVVPAITRILGEAIIAAESKADIEEQRLPQETLVYELLSSQD
jgi:hypothetical protein